MTQEERLDEAFYGVHRLNEMSTISRPVDGLPRNTKICIYGEKDEPGTKVPHMHVVIDNGSIELEVELKHIKQLTIWRTKRNAPKSWDGLASVRKAILEWLDKPSAKRKEYLNRERIVDTWNDNNPTNEIDDSYLL